MERLKGSLSGAAVASAVVAFVLCILGLYPLANRLTAGAALPWYDHAIRIWTFIGGGLLLALFVVSLALPRITESLIDRVTAAVMRVPARVFLTVVALFAFAAAAVIAEYCFGRQPHNADEVAQLFHAKILLNGRLFLPPDPNPEFFGMDNMIEQGKWYSQFPVGWPAVLAFGLLFHAAWLVNPVLLGLTVVATHAFARRAYGEGTARASALLVALAPFALFMSASFMNHMPLAFLTAVVLGQLLRWCDADDATTARRSATWIGLALGIAFTIRPLDALVVAGVAGVMQLAHLWRRRGKLSSLAWQVVAGLVPVAVLFYVNWRTTGAPMRLGYEVLYGSAHSLGFHVDPYGTVHSPLRALMFASKYLGQLDLLLFEWPLPAVAVIVAGILALRRPSRADLLLIGLVAAQTLAYALYWHDGAFRGPRFLFTALVAFVVLAARAPITIAAITRGAARRTALLALPACVLFAWLVPGMSDSVQGRIGMYRNAPPVLRVNPDTVARNAKLANALVFVNEGREARNQHDLWQLGMTRGDAARLLVSGSPCAVRVSINAERGLKPPRAAGRRDRLIRGVLQFDESRPMPVVCAEDILRDQRGTGAYGPFFPANEITSDGHLGGDVVYALDLGEHDEVLRARFGNRTWYRFGPRPRGSALPALVPYVPEAR